MNPWITNFLLLVFSSHESRVGARKARQRTCPRFISVVCGFNWWNWKYFFFFNWLSGCPLKTTTNQTCLNLKSNSQRSLIIRSLVFFSSSCICSPRVLPSDTTSILILILISYTHARTPVRTFVLFLSLSRVSPGKSHRKDIPRWPLSHLSQFLTAVRAWPESLIPGPPPVFIRPSCLGCDFWAPPHHRQLNPAFSWRWVSFPSSSIPTVCRARRLEMSISIVRGGANILNQARDSSFVVSHPVVGF